jgi:hypothetical protein
MSQTGDFIAFLLPVAAVSVWPFLGLNGEFRER